MSCMGVPGGDRDCLTSMGMFTFRNGYCTASCMWDDECGEGAHCVYDYWMGSRLCYLACGSPTQCRTTEGYECRILPASDDSRTYCFPPGP